MLTIILKNRATGEVTSVHPNSLLEDGKELAEHMATMAGGLAKVDVHVSTGRATHRLVPRQRNTGPGRYRWERV